MVAGAGISGIGAAAALKTQNVRIIIFDQNTGLDREKVLSACGGDVELVTGELTDELLKAADLCVLSPGISINAPFMKKISEAGIPVWSEVELAYSLAKGRLAAITGTNGKTTTTALLGEIMKGVSDEVFVVGNIGKAYTTESVKTTENSITVAEISSFQLESVHSFHPQAAAILNLTPDHLDRHGTMECYAQTKERITENQSGDDVLVLNYEDPMLREFAEGLDRNVWFFSSARPMEKGAWLSGKEIFTNVTGETVRVIGTDEMNLLGVHNYENVMAAVLMALAMGAPMDVIRERVGSFTAVEHRIEFVREKDGVKYYNDSKGTNPDAAIRAVDAMTGPTVLIAGGYDKGASFAEWIGAFNGKVKHMFLLGATAEKIAKDADSVGFTDYSFVNDLGEAVKKAAVLARPGEAVLLSPACASWGMFKNYEERGRIFKELVQAL